MQRFRLAHAGGTHFFSVLEKVRHDDRDELRWNYNSGRLASAAQE